MKERLTPNAFSAEKNARGFSIVETIVAISIAILVLGGIAGIAVLAVESGTVSDRQATATEIAEEGLALASNKAANHVSCVQSGSCSISDWQENLTNANVGVSGFKVDATDTGKLAPSATFDPFNSDYLCRKPGGRYGYCGSGELSGNYTRELDILALDDEKTLARVTVDWDTGNTRKRVAAETILFGVGSTTDSSTSDGSGDNCDDPDGDGVCNDGTDNCPSQSGPASNNGCPVNNAPIANPDSATTDQGDTVAIDVLSNDSDPDNDPLSIESATTPSNGNTVITGGQIQYDPAFGFSGLDSFSYTISDGNGGTDSATVDVTVETCILGVICP